MSDSTESPGERKTWRNLLPYIDAEMAGPLFSCFLKRAAAIMSTLVPHLPPLKDIQFSHPTSQLMNITLCLKTLYECANDSKQMREMFDLILDEKTFVYFTIHLSFEVMKLTKDSPSVTSSKLDPEFVVQTWRGSPVIFLALLTSALEESENVQTHLEKQGIFTAIVEQLNQLTSNEIFMTNLTNDQCLSTFIVLFLRILFWYGVKSNEAISLYIQLNLPDTLCALLQASFEFIGIRLMARGLLILCIHPSQEENLKLLQEDEVSALTQWLNGDLPGPFSFPIMFIRSFLSLLEYYIKVKENSICLLESDIPTLLGDLIDVCNDDKENQENIASIIWKIMNYDTCVTSINEPVSSHQFSGISECATMKLNIPLFEEAINFTDILLQYLIRSLLPFQNLPLEDGLEKMSESTWCTISVCISLILLLLSESDDPTTKEIVHHVATVLPHSFKAMQLAFEIALTIKGEGLPNEIMKVRLGDIMKIAMIWTDKSDVLRKKIAESGFVLLCTCVLQASRTLYQETLSQLIPALFTLLNISYDSTNYPAFFFASTIPEVVKFVGIDHFDVSSTAKFLLSCLHQHLDCDQLKALELNSKELEFLVTSLKKAVSSPDLQADGFSISELLQIITNFTHPSHCSKIYSSKQFNGSQPKKQKSPIPSNFDQVMQEISEKLLNNCFSLFQLQIVPILIDCLRTDQFQDLVGKLLWYVFHHKEIIEKTKANFPEICHLLKSLSFSPKPDNQLLCNCCLFLMGETNTEDPMEQFKYAQGCYRFGIYFEASNFCSKIIQHGSLDEQFLNNVKLLKGKSLFYCYQRKLFYLMEMKHSISKEEEKRLMNECFQVMKESISLLGGAFDKLCIDVEGSKLLDWSMMDCIRETNQLNLCKRCLLCRRRDQTLCKSHIFSEFLLNEMEKEFFGKDSQRKEKKIIFGLDKHKIKSTGECWLWLCCKRCEGIMTQNAESDFSQKFPSTGTVNYESWLYNFCCSTIFRTLSCVKFPRSFNDDEVYEVFLYCRKQLLSLPTKFGSVGEQESAGQSWQLKFLNQAVIKQIEPYLFITPQNVGIDYQGMEYKKEFSLAWLATHRLVDGHIDMSGHSHFFIAYCKRIAILLPFSPSSPHSLPKKFLISPLKGTYSIPSDSEALELIPKGMWKLYHRQAIKSFADLTELLQHLPARAGYKIWGENTKMASGKQSGLALSVSNTLSLEQELISRQLLEEQKHKLHLSLLPREFVIHRSPLQTEVKVPQGHKILLHQGTDVITVFLAMNNHFQPYAFFLLKLQNNPVYFVDGAYLTESDSKIVFKDYLLVNTACSEFRTQMKDLELQKNIILNFLTSVMQRHLLSSLEMLIHHYRHLSKRVIDGMVSLDFKCLPDCCWYCKDLCHCCMKPAVLTDETYKFCSKKCKNLLLQREPGYVKVEYLKELELGEFKGPPILDVVNIRKDEKTMLNQIDFISLCLADGSGELYILWQVRSLSSHIFMSFKINDECIPLETLWSTLLQEELSSKLENLIQQGYPQLGEILKCAVQSLGFQTIEAYVKKFKRAIST